MEKDMETRQDLPETPPEEVIEQGVEELTQERDQYKDRLLRSQAEFQNFKRRTERERGDLYRYANEKLLSQLLPVVDTIERALGSFQETMDPKTVQEGIEKIHRSLMEFLDKEGVKPIEALGEPFDHNLHHAVLTEETGEENLVLEELQKGYTINEKILRPSMVKVSK